MLATAVALTLAFWPDPKPDPILLGRGKASVAAVSSPPQPSVESDPTSSASGEETPTTGEDLGSGDASYYGTELEGNPTASGEAFRSEGLTAAHRSLPLGSRIRVTNLRNGEAVVVRVNDRGPFAKNRVVDLSKAAAREIGMLRSGTARVRMELLPGSLPTRG